MKIFIAILGFIVILVFIFIVSLIIATIQAQLCKDCPFKNECDAHQGDRNFTPEYYKRKSRFPHNPMDNSL